MTGHQPGHAIARHTDPTTKLPTHTRRPVGASRLLVDLANRLEECRVLLGSRRHRPRPPRAEARARHPRDATQIRDPILGLMLLNEPEADHGWSPARNRR